MSRGKRYNGERKLNIKKVAEFKGVTTEELAKQTYKNAKKVFEIL